MTYETKQLSHDMRQIREGSASFETRARLEHHLLMVLQEKGTEAVSELLRSLEGYGFERAHDVESPNWTRHASVESGPRRVVVDTCLDPHSASVNVTVEDRSSPPPEQDPRHRAFYEIWESLLGTPDAEVRKLDRKRKAVFLVALLELQRLDDEFLQFGEDLAVLVAEAFLTKNGGAD